MNFGIFRPSDTASPSNNPEEDTANNNDATDGALPAKDGNATLVFRGLPPAPLAPEAQTVVFSPGAAPAAEPEAENPQAVVMDVSEAVAEAALVAEAAPVAEAALVGFETKAAPVPAPEPVPEPVAAPEPAPEPSRTAKRAQTSAGKAAKVNVGDKLRDIPNIKFRASKITGKDEKLEVLYQVIYGKPGSINQRKKGVLDHSGFAFDDEAEREQKRTKVMAAIAELSTEILHNVLQFLDIPTSEAKDGGIGALCDFIFKPSKLSDVDAEAAFKVAKGGTLKRKSTSKKTSGSKKAKKDEQTGQPAAEQPAAEQPAAEQPAAEELAATEPVADQA